MACTGRTIAPAGWRCWRLRLEIADASLLPQRPVTVSVGLVQSQAGEHIDHLLARLATCHGQARREHNAVVG